MSFPFPTFNRKAWRWVALAVVLIGAAVSGAAAETRSLPGHVPEAAARLQPLGRLPATNRLHLAIGLPLRHRDALANLLQRLYDPASPDYHKYLSPEQFTERFGPSEEDYQTVIRFARNNGLEVASTHDSRILLDVQGAAAEVEKAFHVILRTYQHPTEARQFFAPDADPTVDATLPIQEVNGLSDYARLQPASHVKHNSAGGSQASGSGPGGNFMGRDFTNAYLPGGSLNGAGQMVGLFEADGYYANDISNYEALAGLPNVPLIKVSTDGYNGTPGSGNGEVSLDIEMAVAMAPGLSAVVVFEASNNVADWIDIIDDMASSNQIKQFSSSWGYTGGTDPNTVYDAEFQKMAAQGQSFFQAAGDGDAWVNPIWVPADSDYVTSVGGTSLSMTGSGATYGSETVWNSGKLTNIAAWPDNGGGNWGSGGGVSTVYSIPSWQQSAVNTANTGSTNMRNIPDVALVADNIYVIYNNGETNGFMGTSCAAPLWAGFTALANQQAASFGIPTVGFINPAIYTLGQQSAYTSCFHDITTGSNTWSASPASYFAVSGYDLCTGWGTPAGTNLINALAPAGSLLVTPLAGFTANGGSGGPFTVASTNFILTNNGGSPFNWSAGSSASWLGASPASGTLTNGGPGATVTVSLTSAASNLAVGTYIASVWFTNVSDAIPQGRSFALNVLAPPSFTLLPASQSVFSGETAVFSATATGGLPLSYQWQQNGTNLTDGGSITGSGTTNLTITDATATNAGSYAVVVSNYAAVVTSAPPALLTVTPSQQLVQNGGFETGTFSPWTQSGTTSYCYVTRVSTYVYSGSYGAELGPYPFGYLSQTLTTVPGQLYQISLWLNNPPGSDDSGIPNEFLLAWGGTNLFTVDNLPDKGWTNVQLTAAATNTNTVLQLGFENQNAYFGLDDISVLPLRAQLQNVAQAGAFIVFNWIVLQGASYQVQYTTNLAQTNWINLGNPISATGATLTASNAITTNTPQFYRVVLLP